MFNRDQQFVLAVVGLVLAVVLCVAALINNNSKEERIAKAKCVDKAIAASKENLPNAGKADLGWLCR